MRTLGWLPDPHKRPGEKNDEDATEVLRTLRAPPPSWSLRNLARIVDQRSLGSCVANAVGQAIYIAHRRAGVATPKFVSRLFIYYFSRLYHHQTNEDSGTFLRTAFSALNKFGFCPEETWPYDDGPDKFRRMPGWQAMHAAFDQRSPTVYRRIYESGNSRTNAIKAAIAAGYAVAFGTDVSQAFANDDLGEGPIKPPVGMPIAGGHAMTVVGYDGDTYEIANSWGADFGDEGFCRFSGEYMRWGRTNDLWIVENAPKYSG